jgi:hypothetical protein
LISSLGSGETTLGMPEAWLNISNKDAHQMGKKKELLGSSQLTNISCNMLSSSLTWGLLFPAVKTRILHLGFH